MAKFSETYQVEFTEVIGFNNPWAKTEIPCIREIWKRHGEIHRVDEPAIIHRELETGKVIAREWMENGHLHRLHDPALIFEHDGTIVQSFYRQGKLHRDEKHGPAMIDRYFNHDGTCSMEDLLYMKNGRPHRTDGPAWVRRGEGLEMEERWYFNGELHRDDDKPAEIIRHHKTHHLQELSWYQHGKMHRGNGKPAEIVFDTRDDYTPGYFNYGYYEHGIKQKSSERMKLVFEEHIPDLDI